MTDSERTTFLAMFDQNTELLINHEKVLAEGSKKITDFSSHLVDHAETLERHSKMLGKLNRHIRQDIIINMAVAFQSFMLLGLIAYLFIS